MKTFKTKKQVYKYIINSFKKHSEVICIIGSSLSKPLKEFSDIDVNIFSKKHKKPYYEIIFLNKKPILLTVYYQEYVKGKKIKPPKNTKVIYGNYNNNLKPHFGKKKYPLKKRVTRECQLVTDFLFKYFRSRDKTYLEYTQKRLKWK
jgi:hypothetical protein